MSLTAVRAFLAAHAPDLPVEETGLETATVASAAAVHGVEPGRIAKTLALWLGDEAVLLVLAGDTRIDNARYKAAFATKPRMLDADAVLARTGHAVGGVCPFGLPGPMRVFADTALRRFDTVLPAAGSTRSAVRIAPARLVALVDATWVDVSRPAAASMEASPAGPTTTDSA